MTKTKRFTVALGYYSLEADALRSNSYMAPTPLWAFDTDGAVTASRVLAEMIRGKTRRAREVRALQPLRTGLRMSIMTPKGDLPLNMFRRVYLNA
jgi:hypothetical protein